MNDDWPQDVPWDEEAEAMTSSAVVAWTPDGKPRQCLPWWLPRPKIVVVTNSTLIIDGWVIPIQATGRWFYWLTERLDAWNKESSDESNRNQLIGVVNAIEREYFRARRNNTTEVGF